MKEKQGLYFNFVQCFVGMVRQPLQAYLPNAHIVNMFHYTRVQKSSNNSSTHALLSVAHRVQRVHVTVQMCPNKKYINVKKCKFM